MPNEKLHNEPGLLQQLKGSSEAAFTALYNHYHRAIYAYAMDFDGKDWR